MSLSNPGFWQKRHFNGIAILNLLFSVLIAALAIMQANYVAPLFTQPSANKVLAEGKKPLPFQGKNVHYFVPNKGQANKSALYIAKGPGFQFYAAKEESAYLFSGQVKQSLKTASTRRSAFSSKQMPAAYALKIKYIGASEETSIQAHGKDSASFNIINGNRTVSLPTFKEIHYRDIYDRIDLSYKASWDQMGALKTATPAMKYVFTLYPGADYRRIQLGMQGANYLNIDPQGNLHIGTPWGELLDKKPYVYQKKGSKHVAVKAGYSVKGKVLSFKVGAFNKNLPLFIDPGLTYSTFLGGSSGDYANGIAADAQKNIYVAGYTESTDYPTSAGVISPENSGGHDLFITKLNPQGTAIIYSTYIGGSGDDLAFDIAVDSNGNAYVTGDTNSSDFPTTAFAMDSSHNGGWDVFVQKLNQSGTSLAYSSFLGGGNSDFANGIAIDGQDNAYIVGDTGSSDFPSTTGSFDASHNGGRDVFASKISPDGGSLIYSTFLGGGNTEYGFGIALDAQKNAYLTGYTDSGDFPVTSQAFDETPNGDDDIFAAKLNDSGSSLAFSTLLGGSGEDTGMGIAVDSQNNVILTGDTLSDDFPVTKAVDSSSNGSRDAYITKLNPTGSFMHYSTYFGGEGEDFGNNIALDNLQNAYMIGDSSSTDLPVTGNAFSKDNSGASDVYIAKFKPAGQLAYTTYFGGDNDDFGMDIHVNSSQSAYITGDSISSDFPVSAAAFDKTLNFQESFMARWDLDTDIPSGGILINRGADLTAFPAVSFNLSCADSGTGCSAMRSANLLSGISQASFVIFKTIRSWLLLPGDGQKKVFVQYRDKSGNLSAIKSDSIFLDRTAPVIKRGTVARIFKDKSLWRARGFLDDPGCTGRTAACSPQSRLTVRVVNAQRKVVINKTSPWLTDGSLAEITFTLSEIGRYDGQIIFQDRAGNRRLVKRVIMFN